MSSPPTAFSPASSTYTSTSASSPTQQRTPTTRRKRVSAEHTLTRVRENQRRHRARRKDYIATLEERLATAEQQLAEARAEIAVLRRERETGVVVLPCAHGTEDSAVDMDIRRDNVAEHEHMDGVQRESGDEGKELVLSAAQTQLPSQPQPQSQDASPASFQPTINIGINIDSDATLSQTSAFLASLYNLEDPFPIPFSLSTPASLDLDPAAPSSSLSTLGPPPCCEDKPATPSVPTDPECSTCKTRPAPLPTESTTLCAQAYVMISQQNFRDVDAATIRLWLYQGYRRAQRQGEGCRVENGALFRLLDYISGV